MTTTRRMIVEFDPARETTDGKGWKLTWWDQDNASPTTVPVNTTENFTRLASIGRLTASITNKALTTNVATLTTSAAHGFVTGQQVVVSGVGAPFDGNWILASASGTTLTYAVTNANVSSAAVSPNGSAYVPAMATSSAVVTNKALTSNVVTLILASHTFRVGDRVTVSITDPVFDGTYAVVSSTPGFNGTITYARTNANVTSAAASGSVITELSLMDRVRALFNAATDVQTYFNATAQAAVVAANTAAITAATTASLVFEGVV